MSEIVKVLIFGFDRIGFQDLPPVDVKVKDSSNIKEIGGFLDVLDSMLFNIPILYFYLEIFS